MKQIGGWWFPENEKHLPEWMANPKNKLVLNGRQSYQGKKQQAALALCTRFRTAIDVGSHIGLWSFNLTPVFKCVRAFEPVQEHRECFALNVAAENVIVYPIALGDRHDNVDIYSEETSSGNSWVNGHGSIPMAPLDDFLFSDVDFMKLDTEGHEELILRGAEQTIRDCLPVICVEQKRDHATRFGLKPLGAVRFLETLDYVLVKEIGGDYLMAPRAKAAA